MSAMIQTFQKNVQKNYTIFCGPVQNLLIFSRYFYHFHVKKIISPVLNTKSWKSQNMLTSTHYNILQNFKQK